MTIFSKKALREMSPERLLDELEDEAGWRTVRETKGGNKNIENLKAEILRRMTA